MAQARLDDLEPRCGKLHALVGFCTCSIYSGAFIVGPLLVAEESHQL
jgi:hypothetical protein